MGRKYKDFELEQFDDGNAFAEVFAWCVCHKITVFSVDLLVLYTDILPSQVYNSLQILCVIRYIIPNLIPKVGSKWTTAKSEFWLLMMK